MKKRRAYVRGGSISDMTRLLATDETRREPRLARRLFMAGIIVAVVVVALVFATLGFLAKLRNTSSRRPHRAYPRKRAGGIVR